MIWSVENRALRGNRWPIALVAAVLAFTSVIGLVAVMGNTRGRFVKDWQYITDAYIYAEAILTGNLGVVNEVVRAKQPTYLDAPLGYMTFGEGTHFAVDWQPGVDGSDIVTKVSAVSQERLSKRPLPYPPQKVWCIYLDHADKEDMIILVGYHRDMYSAEWIAHVGEQAPFSTDFHNVLSRLECDLKSLAK
jgi:hypothetical protein